KKVEVVQAENKSASKLYNPSSAFPYWHPFLRFLHRGPGKEVWNGLELSGAFHLPQELADFPLVKRIAVKHLLFPPEIAAQIEQAQTPLPPALIGYSSQRGYRVPVLIPYHTLMSHKFLVARSRYGKSSLMQLILSAVLQDCTDPDVPQPGVFIIDPHHDLIEDILLLIPKHRAKDVLLLDLTDKNNPVGLNPLDASIGFSRDQAVSNLMGAFERVWSDFWGPRMSYFLKQVLLLLYTVNEILVQAGRPEEQYTLLDIIPVLQYKRYAIQILSQLDRNNPRHQELMAWWQTVYFTLPDKASFKAEIIMPIISKLSVFQDNEQLRRIVGQPISRTPIHAAVDGKIVLCALSSRDMDDTSVNILGSTLLNLLRRSFRLQESVPLAKRRKIFVAIDEFQAFAGADLGKLLSEDAKFGCACLLATQYLKQLNAIKDGLLETVLGNCETLCAFNVSAADARILEEELQKKVSQKHIISQPRLH
ncbi:MAG: type IV secretion system DNA-binding domain-containing protein, partial [Ktedonobacteraceae bacterium]